VHLGLGRISHCLQPHAQSSTKLGETNDQIIESRFVGLNFALPVFTTPFEMEGTELRDDDKKNLEKTALQQFTTVALAPSSSAVGTLGPLRRAPCSIPLAPLAP